jgi:predicted unusual protein kinase regulating ubiquinone biosynthesis (AarF/ABC1/UbiB family)
MVNMIHTQKIGVMKQGKTPVKPKTTNLGSMLKFGVSYQIKKSGTISKKELAKWTKDQLIELGPTFIKIGQFVSTRSDLFDKDVIKELATLQDRTPSFSIDIVHDIISEDFGKPWQDVFDYINPSPLASASISQVHQARLRTTGEEVVIKIQRPFIQEYFDRDFATLQFLLDIACKTLQQRSLYDTKLLLDDCYEYLYEELSFENEIGNIQKFMDIFKDDDEIVVPKVYEKWSTSRVITMEYIPSEKIGVAKVKMDKSLTAVMLMESFLKQILEHGIIHADPHPGNLGVTKNGRVVLYDYGQVVELDKVFLDNVKPMLFAIYERDVNTVMSLLLKSKAITLKESVDKKSFIFIIEKVLKYFENTNINEFQMSVVNQGIELDLPFKINPKLIMVFRSLSLLEGICKNLDPDFNYFSVFDRIMGDVFLDMDYLDHRARKDIFSFLEGLVRTNPTTFTVANMKPASSVDVENMMMNTMGNSSNGNITDTKNVNSKITPANLQRSVNIYQNALMAMLLCGLWDMGDIPKSLGMIACSLTLYYTIFLSKQ